MRHALEYPVEIGDAVEAAIIGNGSNAVVMAIGQLLTSFIDAHLVQEAHEGM